MILKYVLKVILIRTGKHLATAYGIHKQFISGDVIIKKQQQLDLTKVTFVIRLNKKMEKIFAI